MKIVSSFLGDERRQATRVPVCLAVAAECDAWADLCYTKDVSETGVFLISQRLPSLSVGFSLEVHLPADLGLARMRAQAIRVQGDNPRGFALIFVEPHQQELARIRQLVRRWEDAFGPSPPNSQAL